MRKVLVWLLVLLLCPIGFDAVVSLVRVVV